MTTAQQIKETFGVNGGHVGNELEDGRSVYDVMEAHGGHVTREAHGFCARWTFPDESSIVIDGSFWGVAASSHCLCIGEHGDKCRVGSTVELALDARHDLTEASKCACEACCDAFAEIFESAADDIGEERGFEIRVVRCDYGSPDEHETDHGDDINEIWQECHNRTPWGREERPDDCAERELAEFCVRAILAIERAIDAWDGCDWTHEKRGSDGRTIFEGDYEHETAVICEGGDPDCDYCREAGEGAEAAQEYGRDAIVMLRKCNVDDAREAVGEACELENHWGDAPAWAPVVKLFGAYGDK